MNSKVISSVELSTFWSSSFCISLLRNVTPCVLVDTDVCEDPVAFFRVQGRHEFLTNIFTKLHGTASRNYDIIHCFHILFFRRPLALHPFLGFVFLNQFFRSLPFQRRFFPIIHINFNSLHSSFGLIVRGFTWEEQWTSLQYPSGYAYSRFLSWCSFTG